MALTVRVPTLVDAARAGIAHQQILREVLANQTLPEHFWETHSEEQLMQFWRCQILESKGARIAVLCRGRQIVGMVLIRESQANDHGMGNPARDLELRFLGIIEEFFSESDLQRLFDFVLHPATPAQTWVYRSNQRLRRFLRVNGFTLDGLSVIEEETGLLISRMTR